METYTYIKVPNQISLSEYEQNDYCLAPSKYSRFLPSGNTKYMSLDELCTESKSKITFNKINQYNYSEIGDIDVNNGSVNRNVFYGINLPSENPKKIIQGDIVISTVRTYRGGVGYIYDELKNHCCSPAILVIRSVNPIITKEYLLSVLRTDFFIEQILGFLNRGMYPRLDKEAMKHILIPIPKRKKELEYVTMLMKAYLNKIALIKLRHKKIIQLIDLEITTNQNKKSFNYELPNLNEVETIGRLDVARYSKEYKEFEHQIVNYKNGSFKLSEKGYSVKRGQNLQISNIGESYYSDKAIKGFYRLAVSSNFSEYSTVEKLTYIGNPNNLTKINQGEIVFSARGAQFGRVIIYPENVENVITNIDSLVISNPDAPLFQSIFIAMFLNRLRWNKHIYKVAITGSGANSLTSYQSDDINFPNFSEDKQKEIASLYHNSNSNYQADTFTLDNFLEKDNAFNETAGIYELDQTATQLKEILNRTIDDIVNDRDVQINFK